LGSFLLARFVKNVLGTLPIHVPGKEALAVKFRPILEVSGLQVFIVGENQNRIWYSQFSLAILEQFWNSDLF